ncbi:exoribonuclease 2-like protein [Dinothrombium tinctorium]|uniref:5'-3' exoribonuclease n=1 Tax=Dinothrombium tinctorium TaxID=1965070 RepID=A0A3S3S6H8_9ACAR|nr:exoribonuclease 2-like protein [Dinothrombium tinctorium]
MGVPAFFRWLSKKYPSIVVHCDERQGECSFDNVYLDMNGIIHPCTHPEYKAPPETEEEMFEAIFEYIERLMRIVRPQKLLYLAVDGVAPRAKMNQQRSRRFRASKESLEKKIEIEKIKEELKEKGIVLGETEKKKHFDSNVITPGTDFMISLSKELRKWIDLKLSENNPDEDEIWPKDLKVILSDASVPGEGEHKIMEYIRKQKANDNYNPNISHLLVGADADLIMLALATHELNFTILREEFIPNQPRPCEICNQYGHEMKDCTGEMRDENEPDFIVTEPGFIFIRISVLREYLARECGSDYDLERFIDDFVFLCFFVGNDFLPHLPSLEIREGAIDRLLNIYKDLMSTQPKNSKQYLTQNGFVNLHQTQIILRRLGEVEDEIFKRRQVDQKRFKERRKRQKFQQNKYSFKVPWMRPEVVVQRGERVQSNITNVKVEADRLRYEVHHQQQNQVAAQQLKAMLKSPSEPSNNVNIGKRKYDEMNENDSEEEQDEIKLGSDGWKSRYYYHKFDTTEYFEMGRRVAKEYVIGLCWVLRYYYQGCPDWQWFYPYHYAPFASDFINIEQIKIEFNSEAKPFRPLEQLMSVFPAASSENLPPSWRRLMSDSKSPIIDFYPQNFKIDLNGKHAAWMGVALLPFIDEQRLFTALNTVYPDLTEDEKIRNSLGSHLLFVSRKKREIVEFVKKLEINKSEASVSVYPYLDGMFGTIRLHANYSKIYKNTVCVQFDDPSFPSGFIFLAKKLKGAIPPKSVLKPLDYDNSKGAWRPTIGLQPSYQQARIDDSGKRMINHSTNREQHSSMPNPHFLNHQYDNSFRPPHHSQNMRFTRPPLPMPRVPGPYNPYKQYQYQQQPRNSQQRNTQQIYQQSFHEDPWHRYNQ